MYLKNQHSMTGICYGVLEKRILSDCFNSLWPIDAITHRRSKLVYNVVWLHQAITWTSVDLGIDHGWEGVTATTPEWFVVRRGTSTRAQLEGRPHWTTNQEGVVAVTPDLPWSIRIITWLNNLVSNVFSTKYAQNHHQTERRRLLGSIVTSRISP